MICTKHLKNEIIIPVLNILNLNSEAAVNLLLGTIAQESDGGTYLKQLDDGPGLGIYQIEYNSYIRLKNWYLKRDISLWERAGGFKLRTSNIRENLIGNLYYSTAVARLYYYNIKSPLPDSNDLEGLANYWKKYYNTYMGKGTVDQFIENYKKYVG